MHLEHKKHEFFWMVAEQRKALFLLVLAQTITEANVQVHAIAEGAWLQFCTRVKLLLSDFFTKHNDWLRIG